MNPFAEDLMTALRQLEYAFKKQGLKSGHSIIIPAQTLDYMNHYLPLEFQVTPVPAVYRRRGSPMMLMGMKFIAGEQTTAVDAAAQITFINEIESALQKYWRDRR